MKTEGAFLAVLHKNPPTVSVAIQTNNRATVMPFGNKMHFLAICYVRKYEESALLEDSCFKSFYVHSHAAFTTDRAFETGIFEQGRFRKFSHNPTVVVVP